MMSAKEVERECRDLLALAPSFSTWQLSVADDDFQRQVELRLDDGSCAASVTIQTASATPDILADALARLAEELVLEKTGQRGVVQQFRRELAAAAQKLASTCRVCLQPGGGKGHDQVFGPVINPPTCPEGHEVWRWCPANQWKMCWSGHRWQ